MENERKIDRAFVRFLEGGTEKTRGTVHFFSPYGTKDYQPREKRLLALAVIICTPFMTVAIQGKWTLMITIFIAGEFT